MYNDKVLNKVPFETRRDAEIHRQWSMEHSGQYSLYLKEVKPKGMRKIQGIVVGRGRKRKSSRATGKLLMKAPVKSIFARAKKAKSYKKKAALKAMGYKKIGFLQGLVKAGVRLRSR
jgi:hypothetical protein